MGEEKEENEKGDDIHDVSIIFTYVEQVRNQIERKERKTMPKQLFSVAFCAEIIQLKFSRKGKNPTLTSPY